MAVLVQGVRIDKVEVLRVDDEVKFTANYSLMTPTGHVLAKQDVNGYNSLKIPISKDVAKAIRTLSDVIKAEIETATGLNEGDAE